MLACDRAIYHVVLQACPNQSLLMNLIIMMIRIKKSTYSTVIIVLLMIAQLTVLAQQPDAGSKLNVSGIFPDLALVAGHSPRTEAGIGAMVPWANRLWVITYVAHM